MNIPKQKLYCFIRICERFYFSVETLKKHLQKSHKKEFEILKEKYINKNFNQIYFIITTHKDINNSLDFINFKDLINNDEIKADNNKNIIEYKDDKAKIQKYFHENENNIKSVTIENSINKEEMNELKSKITSKKYNASNIKEDDLIDKANKSYNLNSKNKDWSN